MESYNSSSFPSWTVLRCWHAFTNSLICETNRVGEFSLPLIQINSFGIQNAAMDFLDHNFWHSDHKSLWYEERLSFIKNNGNGWKTLLTQVGSFEFLLTPSQPAFTYSKLTTETKVWNMFKINKKDTRTTPMTSFWCLYS